jgi:alkanesulfonate monooxygenase SsuD/methylene tetrahydromethanopterin reductase-like flavin-dependent oxidoreductase (luciferase family)
VPDHGRELRFGYFLVPDASAPLLDTAREVERRGLDYVAVQDHPYQRRFVDTWVLLSMVAAVTTRVGVFPDVTNLPLRPPAVLAKAAASLDVLSGGRVELGLGAGGFWDAIEAYGGPRRAPGEALAALGEAIEVIRKVWSGERNLRFDGQYYRLAGAQSGPVPAHPIGIWLGAYGPRALALTGRLADGWVPSFRGELAPIVEMTARLDQAAADAGRDPGQIRRVLNIGGEITDGPSVGNLRGPVAQWVDELADLAVGQGFDTFVLWAEGDRQLVRFAEEVVPAVRAQVAAERGG